MLALAAAALRTSGIALASSRAPAAGSNTIHGCVNTTTRALTVIATRPSGTTALVWNKTGPQGPAGAPGWGNVVSGQRYGLAQPQAIAFDGTHIWVANVTGNSVTEVNAAGRG